MENDNIIPFAKDHKFYFKKGSDALVEKDYQTAIRYFWTAIDLVGFSNNFLKANYFLSLAKCYATIENFELSNYCYFCSLDFDVYSQIAFKGLGENFAHLGDIFLTRYYLNQCVNLLDVSNVAKDAKKELKILDSKLTKNFKVVGKENALKMKNDMKQAEFFMSKGKFEQAIEIYENIGDFKNQKIRAELSLCYFFVNETKKSIELIENYGDGTVLDLCNLLLIYFCEGNTKKYLDCRKKLFEKDIVETEDFFKIGLTLAQTNELEFAKNYMKKFLDDTPHEYELKFLYALVCINSQDFETAKRILIDLKILNPFKNYLFDFYLNICDKKEKSKFEYVVNVPVGQYIKVLTKLKSLLTATDIKLKKEFLKEIDLFYFLASLQDSNTKNMILHKLSKLSGDEISQFFRFIFLTNCAKPSLKNSLMINRITSLTNDKFSMVKEGLFVKIILPNLKHIKKSNQNLFEAVGLSVEFLLNEITTININLRKNILNLEKSISKNQVDKYVLSSFLVWDFLKDKKIAHLSKICKFFNVPQETFYQFVETYNLEV